MTREDQFEVFWRCYPRKVAKGTARKSFDKAIKKTTLEKMLDAITRYVANKPEWCDYKHPSTWLQAESWDDEWEPQQACVQKSKPKTMAQFIDMEIENERQKSLGYSKTIDHETERSSGTEATIHFIASAQRY